MIYYPQKESDPLEMKNIFNSLHLIIKIFYDLNAQVKEFRKSELNQSFFVGIARTFRR